MKKVILLIQPPVMRSNTEDESVLEYFETISYKTKYFGDSPTEPNLGLLSIAGVARKYLQDKRIDHEIVVMDLNMVERKIHDETGKIMSCDDIETELKKYKDPIPWIIGLSFMTATYGLWGVKLIRLCRKIFDHSPFIFLGGIHPSVRYKEIYNDITINSLQIEGIVLGEGELVFRNILEICDKNIKIAKQKLAQHANIYTLEDYNRKIKKEKSRLTNIELSELPPPAYDLLYPADESKVIRTYLTRGCSGNCTFCSVRRFHRNITSVEGVNYEHEKVIANLRAILQNEKNIKHLVIGDLSFFDTQMESDNFLRELQKIQNTRNLPLDLWCQTRAEYITQERIDALKKAGCVQIAIGCEGATDTQLKKIAKKEKTTQIEQALKMLKKSGIAIQGYWVIGLPGDDEASVKQTQQKILKYIDNGYNTATHISVLAPYPNTDVAKRPFLNGIKINSEKWDEYWMNCDPYGCGKPVYSTVDKEGRELLSSDKIYELWLETLKLVTKKIKEKKDEN
jgi:radical SAM superfamily enzyme YgiQ (UPF0313 family)